MKADLITAWLFDEGYKHEVDADGDIHFRYNGFHLFFTVDEKDESYFRIIMPNVYTLENNREAVLEMSNALNRNFKVLKSYLVDDRLFFSIELFVDSTPEVGDFFERCCRILEAGYNDFVKMLQG